MGLGDGIGVVGEVEGGLEGLETRRRERGLETRPRKTGAGEGLAGAEDWEVGRRVRRVVMVESWWGMRVGAIVVELRAGGEGWV